MKLEFIDRLFKKNWTDEDISTFIGTYSATYFGYAKDHLIRSNAASGGVVTATLRYLLEKRIVDGALVCRNQVHDNQVELEYFIATKPEDLENSQGSKYISAPFSSKAMPLVREFPGCLAIVALPCDTTLLQSARKTDPLLAEKVKIVITLFCGHLSNKKLTELVLDKLHPSHEAILRDFRYRSGLWRGTLMAAYDDGLVVRKKFSYFSKYQNLYYFCERKCLHCSDHFGYDSDISVGDVWLEQMRDLAIKHSGIIVRNQQMKQLLEEMEQAGVLSLTPQPITRIMDSQARSISTHSNISARAAVAHEFGLKIKDTTGRKVRLLDKIVARIILKNALLSETDEGAEKVRSIPKKLLTIKLYLLKLFETLQ